jgi:hypothetical protein
MIEGTPNRCSDCHWIRRQDDPFRTRLGNECENCHRPISWTAVTWDHAANTGFPIGTQHTTVGCEGCHPSRRFDTPVSPDCFSCHGEDYRGAKNPDHVAAGFPTDCTVCHLPNHSSWRQGLFNHEYQLVGPHATADCASCHSSGVYAGLPSDCVDCHINKYNSTSRPNHPAAGFPTTCDDCHRARDTSWEQGVFNHTAFPIPHRNADCDECHTNTNNFGVFSCTSGGCHPLRETNGHHSEEEAPGYRYDSALCYSCHPNGRAEGDKRLRMRSSHARN